MSDEHTYRARCSWEGSTRAGYEHYDRGHSAGAPPAAASLDLSTDPTFRGRDDLLNPEQLLVMAAASCQLLSFLAVAARARVDVISYQDDAVGFMPLDAQPVAFRRLVLRPTILVGQGPTVERVEHLVELAHEQCYIANSLRCAVEVEPTIAFAGEPS